MGEVYLINRFHKGIFHATSQKNDYWITIIFVITKA